MSDIFCTSSHIKSEQFVWFTLFNVNTRPTSLHLSNYCQKWTQVTICQTDLILTLNCVVASKWVPNLIWQAFYKLPKICFFYTSCRPNEKQPKFDVSLQPPCFTIYSLKIFLSEKFLTDKTYLGYDLSIYVTYLNTTKTFYLINSKNYLANYMPQL